MRGGYGGDAAKNRVSEVVVEKSRWCLMIIRLEHCRTQVADICVEAMVEDAAKNRVFEVAAQENAPYRPIGDLFASVAFRL